MWWWWDRGVVQIDYISKLYVYNRLTDVVFEMKRLQFWLFFPVFRVNSSENKKVLGFNAAKLESSTLCCEL